MSAQTAGVEARGGEEVSRTGSKRGRARKVGMTERRVWENFERQTGMADGPEPDFDKLLSDLKYGDIVAITWKPDGREEEFGALMDYGYVFAWPGRDEGRDANMGGIIHVPDPQNPGGKDRADPEWVTLYELLTNPQVQSVHTVMTMRDSLMAHIHRREARHDLLTAARMALQCFEQADGERVKGWDRQFVKDRLREAIANATGKE